MRKSQKGSGDSGTILVIFGACCAVSVVLIIFSWMGDSMEARRNAITYKKEKESQNYEPFGYEVVYRRGISGYSQEE
jgi:hypothetical protein